MFDYLLALTPSLLLGSMSVLLMYFGGTDRQKVTGLLIGGFVMSVVSTFFFDVSWTWQTVAISFVSGMLLGWGLYDQTRCLRVLGVSRTMPISTGAQLACMSLGGVLLFGEWQSQGALIAGVTGIVLLVGGVWLTSLTETKASSASVSQRLDWARGVRLLVTSTIGLVSYILLTQWFGIDGRDALLPQAFGYLFIGMVLSSAPMARMRGEDDKALGSRWSAVTAKQVISGVIWGGAVLLLQISTARVGVAVGFTLSQLGVILSTLGGIVLLGEHRTRKEAWWTGVGVTLVVLGAVCAGIAKALDI